MIQFNHVCKTDASGHQVLRQINLLIHPGELVLLTGPSGAGKTTLLNLLLRLTKPTKGSIFINNRNIFQLKKSEIPLLRRSLGMVFQHPQLLLQESVYHNVALPLLVAGYKPEEIKRRAYASLKKVNLLEKSVIEAASLSSGEQKLVEVARAIVTTPKILLIDEPTANVDAQTAKAILNLFHAFHKIGVTLIIASHQPNLLLGKQSRTIFLKHGELQKGEKHHATKEWV